MFCPRCSDAQISEDVRFCKRCGLRLEAVHELITSDAKIELRADTSLPPQKEISIGAGLMFLGSVAAMLFSRTHLGGDQDVLPQVYLILSFTLGFTLLLPYPILGRLKKLFSASEPQTDRQEQKTPESNRAGEREGINLGALLMFLGTVFAMVLATLVPDSARRPMVTIEIAAAIFLLLLVVRRLLAGVNRLFFEDSVRQREAQTKRVTSDLQPAFRGLTSDFALPQAQPDSFIPVQKTRADGAEITQPASVTENTTDLLNK